MKNGEASRNQSGKLYTLSDAEKIRFGLKKPESPKGTIHVVIPEHYGSRGVIWMSRFVTEAQLEGYKSQYPDMQIVERKETEDAVH